MSDHDDDRPHWARALNEKLDVALDWLERNHRILERILEMSSTLSQQLDAATAAITSGLGQLSTDISAVAAEVTTLLAGTTTGSTVTQAQVDALTSIASRITALDTSVQSVIAQANPTSSGATPPTSGGPVTSGGTATPLTRSSNP